MQWCADGGVIYGNRATQYLAEGILAADGAHAGRFVEMVADGCVLEPVKTDTVGDSRRARRRCAVSRARVLDPCPAPRTSFAQGAPTVIHAIESTVTVA